MTSLPGPLDYSKKKVMAFLFFLTDSGNQFFFSILSFMRAQGSARMRYVLIE